MSTAPRWTLVIALAAGAALVACVISEQTGHLPQKRPGYGSGYTDPEDVVFHFDSAANKAIVLGRSLALFAAAAWLFFAVRGPAPRVLAVALTAVGAWLLYDGLLTLTRYRVEARIAEGLRLQVPPADPVEIPWGSIETLTISGYEWQRGQNVQFGADRRTIAFTALPDWRTMTIRVADGGSVDLDVGRLSVEQRQNLLSAIVRYGGLVEQK
jgi:hypothetical protein